MQYSFTTPTGPAYKLYLNMLDQTHLMIAGATGSGKSVVVNALMYTALYRLPFDKEDGAQFILIDPKRVELVQYRDLPHTLRYASEPEEMYQALKYAMDLIDAIYTRMQAQRKRKYSGSDVYIIIDEFADLITTQRKRIAPLVQRICQVGRAAKVHMILCTQSPISKIIPTEIKCNFDARVGLRTRSAQDSRNIIGRSGCEMLPRYGYGIYMTPESLTQQPIPMIPDEELDARVEHWMKQYRRQKR